MKHTEAELEKLLEMLIASTRSPRGRYSSANSYPTLEKRLFRSHRYLLPKRIFAVAASIAILCFSTWIAYSYFRPVTLQTVSALSETRQLQLPDGTSVILNHFSSITYPKQFREKQREVTLNGEAYFEVTKDRKHPFIVRTNVINVQVLGTHFNINAYHNNPEITTTLLEGSVAVYNTDHSTQMILKPGEMAIYNKVKQTLIRETLKNANEETAWCSEEILFNQLPLQEIALRLSNLFKVSIRITDSSLRNYRITARFTHGENLETILSLLSETGNFNYSINQKQITITTKPNIQ